MVQFEVIDHREPLAVRPAAASLDSLLHALNLCRYRDIMSSDQWRSELMPFETQWEIAEKPCTDDYDAQLLFIIEDWHRTLDSLRWLEAENMPVSTHWPYALAALNHLILRCHDHIFRYSMRPWHVRRCVPNGSALGQDLLGRGVPQTGVALSRLVTVALLRADFGTWLENIKMEADLSPFNFSKRCASFDIDFIGKDLVWAVADGGVIHHDWARLPLWMLFPDVNPEHFSRRRLHQQWEKPLHFFGAWRNEEDDFSELNLRDERIESDISGELEEW
ncbi:hypothetical protein F4824DRAFT_225898 [Ustulina deusta]|nr:hypothetical protein F4824DRAFT_225898 [Ustulina deusta]